MGCLANFLRSIYARKPRPIMHKVRRLGFEFELNPNECVDGAILFYPQLYERREISFIRSVLPSGGTFLDVGSNIGFYSLVASRLSAH